MPDTKRMDKPQYIRQSPRVWEFALYMVCFWCQPALMFKTKAHQAYRIESIKKWNKTLLDARNGRKYT